MTLPSDASLDQGPALQPPPGVVPNFIDPENMQSTLIATLAVTLGATTFFTAVRMYTKAFILNAIALEDYASCVAWAGSVASTILSAVKLRYGYGLHQWDVPIASAIQFFKLTYIAEVIYGPLIFTVKLTILLQVQHIFATSKSLRFYLVQFMIWGNAGWYLAYTFIVAFALFNTLVALATGPSVVSDVVILALPIFWVWKLQMARRRKLEVSFIFAMGFFATLMSILRLAFGLRFGTDPDQTWLIAKAHNLWSNGEIAAGIMCGCLPTFPRFLAHISSKTSVYLPFRKSPSAQHPEDSRRKDPRILSTRTPLAQAGGDVDDCLQLNGFSSDVNVQDSLADSTSSGG